MTTLTLCIYKMSCFNLCFQFTLLQFVIFIIASKSEATYFTSNNFECGPYGFVCEGKSKLRICEGDNLMGPSFICPPGTTCNEDSSDVCQNNINFVDPIVRSVRCRRNERIADPNVPGCKGYILCIPNKNRFQGIKFKCTGNTVFNGFTRTCSSPNKYKCPLGNTTKASIDLYEGETRRIFNGPEFHYDTSLSVSQGRPIDCKNYKFALTQDNSPVRATYFCPQRPTRTGAPLRCTVFSNQFCIILEKDEHDQFMENAGSAYRRPRSDDLTS